MKTKNILYSTVIAFSFLTLSSCSDFLDTLPDNRTTLDTEEKVASLLVNAYPSSSNLLVNEIMSDNTDFYGSNNPNGDRFGDQVYFWEDLTESGNESTLNLWRSCYFAIGNCNQALAAIEEFGGPNTPQLSLSKGEALMCRAYINFLLVNQFCVNYNARTSKTDPGIPLSLEVEKDFTKHYDRGTVAEVYERIDKDIQEALPLITDNYKVPKYHFNKAAAYAFAARFYLYYEKWDKVVKYADLCLGDNPSMMLRDWKNIGEKTSEFEALSQHYIDASLNCNLLLSQYVSNVAVYLGPYTIYKRYSHGNYLANNEDLNAINVWGKANFYARVFNLTGNNFDIVQVWKLPYLFEYNDPVSQTGYPHTVNVLFSADETLLCRAEAYTMLKEYDKAAKDLDTWMHNIVRSDVTLTPQVIEDFYNSVDYSYSDKDKMLSTVKKHLHPAFKIDKEGSRQETMLQCVLGFRRIETLHQGLRWFDVKRYGIEIVRREMGVKGVPVKLLDVLKVDDPRRATQIPLDIRQAGVKPNPR